MDKAQGKAFGSSEKNVRCPCLLRGERSLISFQHRFPHWENHAICLPPDDRDTQDLVKSSLGTTAYLTVALFMKTRQTRGHGCADVISFSRCSDRPDGDRTLYPEPSLSNEPETSLSRRLIPFHTPLASVHHNARAFDSVAGEYVGGLGRRDSEEHS